MQNLQNALANFEQLELAPLTYTVCFSYSDSTEQHVELVDYPTVEDTLEQFARVGATVHSIRDMSAQTVYKKIKSIESNTYA